MTEPNWLDRLNQSRDRIEALQNQFLAEVRKEISEVFAEFFIQNPDVTQVWWRQYWEDTGDLWVINSKAEAQLNEFIQEHRSLLLTLFGQNKSVFATRNGFEVKDV